jgi:hypothetical protein
MVGLEHDPSAGADVLHYDFLTNDSELG